MSVKKKSFWSKPKSYLFLFVALFIFVFLVTRLVFIWGVSASQSGFVKFLFGSGTIENYYWLNFWGNLLSFLGTMFLGGVALYQLIITRKSNQTLINIEQRREAIENSPELWIYTKISHINQRDAIIQIQKQITENSGNRVLAEHFTKEKKVAEDKLNELVNRMKCIIPRELITDDNSVTIRDGIGQTSDDDFNGAYFAFDIRISNFKGYKINKMQELALSFSFENVKAPTEKYEINEISSCFIGNNPYNNTEEKKIESLKSIWNEHALRLRLIPRNSWLSHAFKDSNIHLNVHAKITTSLNIRYEIDCEMNCRVDRDAVSLCLVNPILDLE